MTEKPTYDELKQIIGRLKTRLSRYVELEKAGCLIDGPKPAETAALIGEEKYRQLFDRTGEAVFVVQDNVVKSSNPKTRELIGCSVEDLRKKPPVEWIHPDDRGMICERYRKIIDGEQPDSPLVFRIVSKAGKEIWVQLTVVLTAWEGKPATINFLRNITRQRKLESQLLLARKMEAIGTLAGGIAHDFNNLLMGINGRTALALLEMETSHPAYIHLKGVEELVKSASELTRRLLGFAKVGKYELKPIDINEMAERTAAIFARSRQEISVQTRLTPHLWGVEADEGQMEQVLLSLYLNGWQAMPRGGKITVETENIFMPAEIQAPYWVERGRYVRISVIDTGIGMDEKTQDRIFEPFFTTKEMGRGTGLGLSSVYGIVRNHRGHIDVESKKGEGTTLSVYLPAMEKEVVRDVERDEPESDTPETVLIIDDEKIILAIARQLLEKLGCRALTAASAQAGIDLLRQQRGRIDLIILDLVMPDMDGRQLYRELKRTDPAVKVLITSGYSVDRYARELMKDGVDGFLQKPFTMKTLSQKLRQVLDEEVTPLPIR